MAQLGLPDHLDTWEIRDVRAARVCRDLLATQAQLGLWDTLDRLVFKAQLDSQDRQVSKERVGLQDPPDRLVFKAQLVSLGQQVFGDGPVRRGRQVFKDQQVSLGQQVFRD